METINVVICDDHQIVVEGIESIMEKESDILVCGIANNFRGMKSLINQHKTDVIVTDLNMPGKNGLEMIRELKEGYPHIRLIALTMYYDRKMVSQLYELGLDAFLMKDLRRDELVHAIRTVAKGDKYKPYVPGSDKADYDFAFKINEKIRDTFISQFKFGKREMEVFILVAQGRSTKEIASILGIAFETVKSHRKSIIAKTGFKNSLEVALFAVRNQII